MRPRSSPRLAWLILTILTGFGASDPAEVVKVRVPASKIPGWFPAGTDLETMTPERFDELLKAARDRTRPSNAPRILRARHSARLDSGVLIGRSELTIESSADNGSRLVVIEPWSPALEASAAGSKHFRSSSDGRLAIKVDASSPQTIEANWRLKGLPGSEGRVISLGLPELDVASLVLDLPAGWIPESKAGPRVGPEPGSSPDRATWRFEAARGTIDLRLRNPAVDSGKPGSPGLWLEGTTRVDLNQGPSNWRADWTLDESPGAPQLLTVELDPGLELVEVVGPRVVSFREEPAGTSTRVTIKLDGQGSGPSALTIKGIVPVPAEGLWAVPSARPTDAIWTGGRTLVTLDGSRVLQACSERAGRRIPVRPGDSVDSPTLIFEGKGEAGPVAELTFRKPSADATVNIRGHLILGDDAPRVEVALTWMVERGRLLTHAVDLSPGWEPDRVLSSDKQPVPWHAEPLANGGTRVQIGPSVADENAMIRTLILKAFASKAGVTGLLDLPRVRPAPGIRVVDEVWAATPAPKLALRPIKGEGLAWIDPLDPPLNEVPVPWLADDLKNALAWRWLADDAEARINRTLPLDRPRAEIKLDASIVKGRLELKWSLAIDKDLDDLRSIPIHLDEAGETPIHWRARDGSGLIVEARPIDESRRAKLGFPATGSSWELELSGAVPSQVLLVGTINRPWTGQGRIPILNLPDRFRAPGLVTLIVDDTTRLKIEANGLTPIDRSIGLRETAGLEQEVVPSENSRTRRAALFAYRSSGGRLNVETIGDPGQFATGLIRESFLISQVFPGLGIRHRLTLRIAGLSGGSIALKMPKDAVIDRIRRDGQPVAASQQAGSSFRVEIPDGANSRIDSNLTIDYRTPTDVNQGPVEPSRLLPECSLACLSFVWEVVAPDPWIVADDVLGLVATDPQSTRSTLARLVGFGFDPWTHSAGPSAASAASMLADLDRSAAEFAGSESRLGDWLLKLDAGRWPVVIDRLALRSSGWGPASRISLDSPEVKSLGPVKGVLQPLGLTALPLGGTILVTSRMEVPERPADRSAWTTALQRVPVVGSDVTDRFQSAARWRGEATPRALAAGESLERAPGPGGWRTRRLVSSSWPNLGASVRLVNARVDQARGWFVTSVIIAGGILFRKRSATLRAVGLAILGVGVSIALAWSWPEPPSWASGWLRGFLAMSCFWTIQSFRRTVGSATTPPVEGSTHRRRSGFLAGAASLGLVIASTGHLAIATADGQSPDAPILALLVFDGVPDATSKPDRVVLSLQDADRLRRLAEPAPAVQLPVLSLSAASHRIGRQGPKLATVESQFEVEVDSIGDQPASWTIPVGLARDLSATVDGHAQPLRISDDGASASVLLNGVGRHAVVCRRSLPLNEFGTGVERLLVPINPAAFARVTVVNGPGAQRIEIPSVLGAVEVVPDGVDGMLGPARQLDVRWSLADRAPESGFEGSVEAVMLWDARPVGDLIRVRLTHADPNGASTIRLALEPGLVVRRHSIPNVVSVRQEGTTERPEWVARIDPPLLKETPVEIELWRTNSTPGSSERRWPSIEISASGKVSQILGFRRPGDWSGRLDPIPNLGVEAVPEANFSKTWGTLDDAGLTFAGAVRFSQSPAIRVAIRPILLRRSIESKVQVGLAPGRLDLVIEATLTDLQGRSFELILGLPNNLRLIKVDGTGLVDWQKLARDRLRLQFDGSAVPQRLIRIEGYLPVPADSVMTEARTYQTKIPWPRWSDAETLPATLSVTGATRFQVEQGEGVVALPAVPSADSTFRSTFRVDRPAGLSTTRWSAPPARFAVSVQSDLTIDPDAMHWTAVVTSEIAGGPADSLQWDLPTEWAKNARLEIEGHPHRLVAEPKGAKGETTRWTILPESPLWGRVTLILRSRRPIESGVQIPYPEIAPLAAAGRGSVERYELAISNVSGREVKRGGLKGLKAVEPSRVGSNDALGLPGSIDQVYQVTGGRWALNLEIGPRAETEPNGGESRLTRVANASITAVVAENGEVWGRARFDLEDRPGPFLEFSLPDTAEVPWSMVDGMIQPVFRANPGRWLVPLGDRLASRVLVLWHRRTSETENPATQSLAIPSVSLQRTPTLVTVFGPLNTTFRPTSQAFENLDPASSEVEAIERLASRITRALGQFDRSWTSERERLVEDMVDLELLRRKFARRASTSPQPTGSGLERINAAMTAVEEAVESNGLDDLSQDAQARVGLARELEDSSKVLPFNPADLVRVRRVGLPSYFRSRNEGTKESPTFVMSRASQPSRSMEFERWGILGVGLAISMACGRWIARPRIRLQRAVYSG